MRKRGLPGYPIARTKRVTVFNDQPSLVEVDHCAQDEKKYLFWHKENFRRRSLGKPHAIYLENGIIMDMAFNDSEPEKMKKVHPDYRDDWIRLYAQESGK